MTHKTMHAGEDFPHLLCGLAYMYDTMFFLELSDGDRIGHGTAMGIDPSLWIRRMPQEVLVKQGEWFLSLLATRQLALKCPDGLKTALVKIEADIQLLSLDLFGESLSPFDCEQAMKLRGLSLPELNRFMPDPSKYNTYVLASDYLASEIELIKEQYRKNKVALERLWKWQSDPDLWNKSEAFISVESQYLSDSDYLLLQQSLMNEVNSRGVVI